MLFKFSVIPEFVVVPEDVVVSSPETATFTCSAEGKPTPVITWWRNEVQLMPGDRITITESSPEELTSASELILSSTQVTDAGTYFCVATNAVNSITAQATLTVQSM